MAETWNEVQLIADGFERVYVEFEWCSGPRVGLGDVDGMPHYFQGDDWDDAEEADEYRVWPASDAAVELETHPGQGGIDARYDELALLLAQYRQAPDDAKRLVGEVRFDAGARYRVEGLDYWFRWRPSRP
ncbi:hypothetical protein [Streptomyces sp. NPDC051704]|uniref:hypothetical protein n=1 Tax=Streptomyces sp. NPDC051704 TaxID=3365671 RepID=UPI00379E4832